MNIQSLNLKLFTMKSPIVLPILSFIILIAQNLNAQNCDQCAIALKGDVMDEFQQIYSTSFHEADSIAFAHSFEYWESVANSSNSSMQSGGAYGIISGYLNGSTNRSESKQKFISDSIAFRRNTEISSTTYLNIAQRMHSLVAYDAWTKCIIACNNDGMFFSKTNNGSEVLVSLFFKHQNSSDKYPIIVTLINVDPVGRPRLKSGINIRGGETLSGAFRLRNQNRDGMIKVDIGGGYQTNPIIIPSAISVPAPKTFMQAQVKIEPGQFNEHATYRFTGGIDDPDPEKDLRNAWRQMPWSGGLLYKEAAWISTKPFATLLVSNDSVFQWNLEIQNKLGAKSFGQAAALGGESHAEPAYRTKITIPTLREPDSYYTLSVRCWSWSELDNPRVGTGSVGIVKVSAGNFERAFKFVVRNVKNSDSSIVIPKILAGEYTIELQVPRLSLDAYGPPTIVQSNFETNLRIDAAATIVQPKVEPTPDPPKPTYWPWYLGGAILLGVIAWLSIRKRSTR